MKQYKLWDRQSKINGVNAGHFLSQAPFKGYDGDIILIYADDGVTVTNVECKDILAQLTGIDRNLPLDEFMAKFFTAEEIKM